VISGEKPLTFPFEGGPFMVSGSWARYAPLSGLLFVALLVVSIVITGFDSVDSNDSVVKVVKFWHDNDSEQMAGAIIGAVATIPFLWFLGSLRSTFREAEGGTGRLTSIAYAGGIVLAGFALADGALQFAVAESVGDIPPVATQTLSALYNNFFFGFPAGIGTLLLASSLVIVRFGALPAWMGWFAFVLGIISITPLGFFAFLAVLLWIAIASWMLFTQQRPATPGQTALPTT
jgi:hypothetical protein